MKYYDDYQDFACMIDIVAFDKTLGKEKLFYSKPDEPGILICHKEDIKTINVSSYAKIIPKPLYEYGIKIASEILDMNPKEKAKIELKGLTEWESLIEDVLFTNIKVRNKEWIAVKFCKYQSNKLIIPIPLYSTIMMPITDSITDPLTGTVIEIVVDEIPVDDIIMDYDYVEIDYKLTKNDFIFLTPEDFATRKVKIGEKIQNVERSTLVLPAKLKRPKEFITAFEQMENTQNSLFITGIAGTGKSVLLKYFSKETRKSTVVVAFTGIAALNVAGQTIHSFFKLPLGIIDVRNWYPSRQPIYKKINTIVIDEVSMVRADILDAIDKLMRANQDRKKPFGGVQVIFFGDPYQLSPFIPNDEDSKLFFENRYESGWFFDAILFKENQVDFRVIELSKVYRQRDRNFLELLNDIRTGNPDNTTLEKLNERYFLSTRIDANQETRIVLGSTNEIVDNINQHRLKKLKGKIVIYEGRVVGEFDKSIRPTNVLLELKEGSQIMFVKNDPQHRWVNGTIGKVYRLSNNKIEVDCKGHILEVDQVIWENYRYQYSRKTKEIKKIVIGNFIQYPLKLAWAVTIHKSQGKTFENVEIDLGYGAFAHGQTYVALSRCTTLDGIILKQKINGSDIIVDERVNEFCENYNFRL